MVLKEKLKKEGIPLTTIKPESVKKALERGYDSVVNGVLNDLKKMAVDCKKEIMEEVKKGNMEGAQELIDNAPALFRIDVKGKTVKVAVADPEGIKKSLEANKADFVKNVSELVNSNMTPEIKKSLSSWSFSFYGEENETLAELFSKNLNEELGLTPPPGINPTEKIPEENKIDFNDARIPKDKLPVYTTQTEGEVTFHWPEWMKPRPKEFAAIPKKVE